MIQPVECGPMTSASWRDSSLRPLRISERHLRGASGAGVVARPGKNLVLNGTFDAGFKSWVADHSTLIDDPANPQARITSTATDTARLVQDIAPLLAPTPTMR